MGKMGMFQVTRRVSLSLKWNYSIQSEQIEVLVDVL